MENDKDGIRPAPTMYYVYVLKDKMTGRVYYGYTADLGRRTGEHDRRKDGKLVYYEAYKAKADAVRRERKLKITVMPLLP